MNMLLTTVTGFLLIFVTASNTFPTSAQLPSIPSLPNNDGANPPEGGQPAPSSTLNPTLPPNTPTPTIEITSIQDGQQVPAGELTIEGISSDDEERNCQVYADVNDITPLQNATASGDSGKENDFSKWSFTYTQDYQLINEGSNELTAKISCYPAGNPTPISEWHTVNVTGAATGVPAATQGRTTEEPTSNNGITSNEEPDSGASEDEDDQGTSLFG
jgi:hypothetical protein